MCGRMAARVRFRGTSAEVDSNCGDVAAEAAACAAAWQRACVSAETSAEVDWNCGEVAAAGLFELGACHEPRIVEQQGLVCRRCDPYHGAHLGARDLGAAQSAMDHGDIRELVSDADVIARGTWLAPLTHEEHDHGRHQHCEQDDGVDHVVLRRFVAHVARVPPCDRDGAWRCRRSHAAVGVFNQKMKTRHGSSISRRTCRRARIDRG